MKNLVHLITICFGLQIGVAQNITAKIIDKNTQSPIPFAAIQTGESSGVISNEEGYFTLYMQNENTELTISSMGYLTKILSIAHVKSLNNIISLETALNQLEEVYISNKRPSVDSIIARIKRYSEKNYSATLRQYDIFRRVADYNVIKKLTFEINKASQVKKKKLTQVNTDLQALTKSIITNKSVQFLDLKGSLYTQTKDSSKFTVSKVTKLLDSTNNFSIENVQNRLKNIMLQYLDTTKTYKVKTGLFKIEDSLSFEKIKKERAKADNQAFDTENLKKSTKQVLKYSQFNDNSFLMNLLNPRLYEYFIDDMTIHNDQLTYILRYQPRKGKAKYSGKLYVNDSDYAITKVTYSYFENRHGSKLNLKFLLGVKFEENLNTGLILFEKQNDSTYQPKYIKHENGNYFYLNRDLTLIENSKNKNKLSTDFTIEGNSRTKEELLITNTKPITLNQYNTVTQQKKVSYETLKKFDNTIWSGDETLEPLLEMKAFGNESN